MTVDFHTHCFPDKIAERAICKLSFASGGLINYTDGTKNGLMNSMKAEGVDISVVLNIATNEHQMQSVNDFACELNKEKGLVAFGSVYPWAPNALEELERIKAMGLLGVKLHPEYQGFYVDDEKMKPIYKKISDLGLITVFHSGEDYGFDAPYHCMPESLAKALSWFSSPVVAAHWGGLNATERVLNALDKAECLFIDTSFGYGQLSRSTALKIIEKFGVDRLLFATDSPWHTPSLERRLIETMGLSENEKNDVFSGNAKKLLKI